MRTLRLLPFALTLAAAPLAAQGNGFYDGRSAVTGVQFKTYSFGDGAEFEKASQVAIPVAAVIPVNGRFSLDLGTFYAMTSTTTSSDGDHSVSGLTDLQIRGAYTLGRDAAVVSLVMNLPTGVKFDGTDAITAGAAASNFLLFPVNSYSNGLSATGGVGIAKRVGDWGIGVAGSFRWNAEYSPYVDGTTIINGTDTIVDPTYEPGFEGKIRVGADRSIGQGRFRVGLTFSTFGDDTFGAGSGSDTKYSPGNRFIAEGAYSWPGFGGTISAYAWNYHRSSGATEASDVDNSENILTAGLVARRSMGPNTTFEPAIEGRFWSYNAGDGGGKVVAFGAGLRHRVNERMSIVPNARVEVGTLDLVGGDTASLTGFGASVFLRYGF
jgi:hypothetical protein